MGIESYWETLTCPLTSMDTSSRQKIKKAKETLKDTIEMLDLIDVFPGHYIQKIHNAHSSQVHMEHSQESVTYWGTKITSINLGA